MNLKKQLQKVEYKTICEDCGKVFMAKSNKAFLCPKCVKKRISNANKKQN